MEKVEITEKLKNMLIERLFLPYSPEELDCSKNLITEYGIDSVSILEMVVGLEEEFGIRFNEGEFDIKHFETIDSMADFVIGKIS